MDVAEAKSLYQEHFARLEREAAGNGWSWTYPIRKAAISSFVEQGFPTTRHEDWKYTNVAPITAVPFSPAGSDLRGLGAEMVERLAFGEREDSLLVFANGYYAEELSSPGPLPQGVKAGSLAAAIAADTGWVEPHLARYASFRDQAFVALNTAFMKDGAFLFIPEGRFVEKPIHLLFISAAPGEATVSYPRNLILIGQGSQATVVESYAGLGEGPYLTNGVTELVVGENAVIDHCRVGREGEKAFHVGTLQVRLGRNSQITSHSIALGGSLVRNEINIVLDGEGAECTLNGLYMAAGQQHVDNQTRIDHAKPHGTSRELYKGILDGRTRGVFNGKIVVRKSAAKTDARQINKNLLLSEEALVHTKPQLEIHNNDVKCSHGSTIGQLDPDAVFYLRSRGVDLEAARSLLTYAFASEIVNRIKLGSLRAFLEEQLLSRLRRTTEKKEAV